MSSAHIPVNPTSFLVVRPRIFREYIGVKPYPESLNDFPASIINKNISEFHFILGIATETQEGGKGTGWFNRTWNFDYFSPEKVVALKKNVESLKEKHPDVKVIISIGGRGTDNAFNPAEEPAIWIEKAVRSIKVILEDYKVEDPCSCQSHYTIDGIDINYEVVKSNEKVFSRCIGQVIKKLKDSDIHVNVVSIAPSILVQPHYKQLYWDFQAKIDWVNYQFYNHDVSPNADEKVSPKDKFVNLYKSLVKEYSDGIVLAGVSSDPDNKDNMPREVFIDGCTDLISTKSLPGIFVWNANDSYTPSSNDDERFYLEQISQDLLTT